MSAGLEISLRIGQHVRHRDFHGKRVTGVVRGLSVDSEDVLYADIALDEAIVIPPITDGDRELRVYRQHVPAHELAPFDERDELMAEMLDQLQFLIRFHDQLTPSDIQRAKAVVAKAGGADGR